MFRKCLDLMRMVLGSVTYSHSAAAGSIVTRDTTETVTIQLSKGGRKLVVEPGVRIFIDMVGIRTSLADPPAAS